MTAERWTTIAVALVGVAGTLLGALITQRRADILERERRQFEAANAEAASKRSQDAEHRTWLRSQRYEVYGELVQASRQFFMEITPMIDMRDRIDDPGSDLYKARHHFFGVMYRASFLAEDELQQVIRRAADNTENLGHTPYEDTPHEQREFERRVFHEAFAITGALEDATRAELRLPPRRQSATSP